MKRDYRAWTPLKQSLNNTDEPRLFFHEREIWYCHLGENIGFEQDGRGDQFLRPVIIIRKFNNDIFWGIPLTRTQKDLPFYFTFVPRFETAVQGEKVQPYFLKCVLLMRSDCVACLAIFQKKISLP